MTGGGGAKAVHYAEETLGVHAVMAEAEELAKTLAGFRRQAVHLRATRRMEEQALESRSFELLSDLRGMYPDESNASIERKHKELLHSDTLCRSMRNDLRGTVDTLDEVEAEISIAKTRLEVLTARMAELGGYLAYLASVKSAATAARVAASDPDNWPATPSSP